MACACPRRLLRLQSIDTRRFGQGRRGGRPAPSARGGARATSPPAPACPQPVARTPCERNGGASVNRRACRTPCRGGRRGSAGRRRAPALAGGAGGACTAPPLRAWLPGTRPLPRAEIEWRVPRPLAASPPDSKAPKNCPLPPPARPPDHTALRGDPIPPAAPSPSRPRWRPDWTPSMSASCGPYSSCRTTGAAPTATRSCVGAGGPERAVASAAGWWLIAGARGRRGARGRAPLPASTDGARGGPSAPTPAVRLSPSTGPPVRCHRFQHLCVHRL